MKEDPLNSPLRLAVIFHETEPLGASYSILRALDDLGSFGWTAFGWAPGDGSLIRRASSGISEWRYATSPMAYSSAGWRAHPGAASRARRMPSYLRQVRAALIRWQPHVVHVNTLLALPEALVARSLGLPVVFHVHELPPATTKRRAAVALASRLADVLVAVSKPVERMLLDEGRSAPVVVVHNGAPKTPPRHMRSPPDVGASASVVGTVGTVSRRKGTDVFLHAAERIRTEQPALKFEHIGPSGVAGDPSFDKEMSAHDERLSRGREPILKGRGDVPSALARWEMFVLPSREDPFPLAILEAMAAGLPIIASSVGGIPEQISHLETGILVAPDDPEALARWILRLHDEPTLRQRLGAAAATRASSAFSLEAQATGLHGAYLRAINARYAPAT